MSIQNSELPEEGQMSQLLSFEAYFQKIQQKIKKKQAQSELDSNLIDVNQFSKLFTYLHNMNSHNVYAMQNNATRSQQLELIAKQLTNRLNQQQQLLAQNGQKIEQALQMVSEQNQQLKQKKQIMQDRFIVVSAENEKFGEVLGDKDKLIQDQNQNGNQLKRQYKKKYQLYQKEHTNFITQIKENCKEIHQKRAEIDVISKEKSVLEYEENEKFQIKQKIESLQVYQKSNYDVYQVETTSKIQSLGNECKLFDNQILNYKQKIEQMKIDNIALEKSLDQQTQEKSKIQASNEAICKLLENQSKEYLKKYQNHQNKQLQDNHQNNVLLQKHCHDLQTNIKKLDKKIVKLQDRERDFKLFQLDFEVQKTAFEEQEKVNTNYRIMVQKEHSDLHQKLQETIQNLEDTLEKLDLNINKEKKKNTILKVFYQKQITLNNTSQRDFNLLREVKDVKKMDYNYEYQKQIFIENQEEQKKLDKTVKIEKIHKKEMPIRDELFDDQREIDHEWAQMMQKLDSFKVEG